MIAIENTRLLNELRQRTDDLSESLQQQTATADVLKVISRSTFDLRAVLNTLVESATRLCEAFDAVILLREGEWLVFGAHHGPIPLDLARRPITRTLTVGRAVIDRKPVHVDDLAASGDEFPEGQAMALRQGFRTMLSLPLLRGDQAIGSLSIRRSEVRPFTDKQIELATTFADQAVIAIENVRLFEAEQQRTRELSEALEQQTATSEVLRVISNSPDDLKPVFQAMLENATRICGAKFGVLWQAEGQGYRTVAMYGVPPAYASAREQEPVIYPSPEIPLARVASTKQVLQVADIRKDESYIKGFRPIVNLADNGGARTLLMVPMLKEKELIGAIAIFRQEVLLFADKQIELVKNFAAQAVIAIENTRLLNELRQRTDDLSEALEQQTATSEVLKVISSSPANLELVFQSMLSNALRICDAEFGAMFRFDGDENYPVAEMNSPPALKEWLTQRGRRRSPAGQSLHHVLETKQVYHVIDDLTSDNPSPPARLGGARTHLAVPMLKDNDLVGAIIIYRQEVRPFADKQIDLVKNFAAQAVIAIENARLLNELRAERWNDRPRPQRSCKSSPVHPAICSRCSVRCWRTRPAFVMRNSQTCSFLMAMCSEWPLCMARRLNGPPFGAAIQ